MTLVEIGFAALLAAGLIVMIVMIARGDARERREMKHSVELDKLRSDIASIRAGIATASRSNRREMDRQIAQIRRLESDIASIRAGRAASLTPTRGCSLDAMRKGNR